jgi:DNA invertase Pin-like site-specific DNA recombinase
MNMPILDTRPRGNDNTFDVSELVQNIVLEVFSWMAQKETEERKRRQMGGIEAAKRAGKYKGKQPMKIDKELFEKLYGEVKRKERTATYAMGKLGVKRNTWYVLVNEYETRTGRFE